MPFLSTLAQALLAVTLLQPTTAHPGEHHDHAAVAHEIRKREALAHRSRASLNKCTHSAEHQALMQRGLARRAEKLATLRKEMGIEVKPQKYRRDLATLQEFETVNHNMTALDHYDFSTPEHAIFGANTSAILTPEVTAGPYYVTGETIRQNVKEPLYSSGVDLRLEVQYIDVATCAPVPGVAVDIWNANATGVYSGISTDGNYAAEGYNSTYLRGVQFTDDDGVVTFDSIFPGHYEGRATHTHLLAHMNTTTFPNATISASGNVTHIGQLFYPTALREAVEATYPYTTNTQPITSNDEDMWDIVQTGSVYDPFPEYVYLGDEVGAGLLAWIQIGIDVSANYADDEYYAVAAYVDAEGGHESEGGGMVGGGGGMGGGNGTNGTAVPSDGAMMGGAKR